MRKLLILLILSLLIASLSLSCADERAGEEETINWTSEQIIASVQVLGLPHYFEGQQITPIGQWAAIYEGDNNWKVQGSILTIYQNRDYVRTTTWLHTASQIELLDVVGDSPPSSVNVKSKPAPGGISVEEALRQLQEARK